MQIKDLSLSGNLSKHRPRLLVFLFYAFLLTACTPQAAVPTSEITDAASAQPNTAVSTEALVSSSTSEPVAEPTTSPPQISNLALGQPVITSGTQSGNPAELAVDGINRSNNFWSAGEEAPQWIEIDLGSAANIYEIQLFVYQYPAGDSIHRVLGRTARADDFQELHVFAEFTQDGQILSFEPTEPWPDLRFIRVETLESAPEAYVEWREIEIFGLPAGIELPPSQESDPEIIFYNGNLITMNPNQPSASALAINTDLILAVGSDEDVLPLAGPATQLIDLKGLTLMPGIVDPHTHILKDWEGIEPGQTAAIENGITTLVEMSAHADFIDEISQFAATGQLRVRTSIYMIYADLCGILQGDWYLEHPPEEILAERLRIGGVKVTLDGGVCKLPAVSFEYPTVGGFGDLYFEQDQMNEIVKEIHDNGYQVAIHAQGDRAIEVAQSAIENALAGAPNLPRHRIEHNPFPSSESLPRYSEIGIVPTIVFGYATCAEIHENTYSNFFGFENLSWLENWRDFVDANPDLIIAWHGDDPWIPPLSPFLELYGVVTRNEVAEDGSVCEAPDWLVGHGITTEEALPMMTINAAYALHMEDQVGSLEVGKFADMLVISGDPLEDPYAIKDIEVWMTMIGGEVEYCAAPDTSLCP